MTADREITPPAMPLALCPFCGAGETHIHVNKGTWTGMGYGEPVSVEVRHFCEPIAGQPSRGIFRVGRDLQSAVDAWNRRAPVQAAQAATAEPVAWQARHYYSDDHVWSNWYEVLACNLEEMQRWQSRSPDTRQLRCLYTKPEGQERSEG